MDAIVYLGPAAAFSQKWPKHLIHTWLQPGEKAVNAKNWRSLEFRGPRLKPGVNETKPHGTSRVGFWDKALRLSRAFDPLLALGVLTSCVDEPNSLRSRSSPPLNQPITKIDRHSHRRRDR
jgi:hypothetical protein